MKEKTKGKGYGVECLVGSDQVTVTNSQKTRPKAKCLVSLSQLQGYSETTNK